MLASLDQSLGRMGLDYVDIFYSHRYDPETPIEETMMALDHAVRTGKALYAGISSYSAAKTHEAATIARDLGTPLLIHQPSYSILNRWIEGDLLDELEEQGMGCIVFSALAQGLLTGRYLDGVPEDSRAARSGSTVPEESFATRPWPGSADSTRSRPERGQSLAQLALQWVLRDAAGDLGGHRRLVGGAARRQPRCAGLPRPDRRRADPDRPARGRGRDQPVGEADRGR